MKITTISPRSRFRLILLFFLLGVSGVALLNYVVNPYRYYPPDLVPPLVMQPRTDKYRLVLAHPELAQQVIMGSSRIILMKPHLVADLTGIPTFNLAVSRAMPRDFLIFTRFALDQLPTKRIIAAIDLQSFNGVEVWDNGSWLATSLLRRYSTETINTPSLEETLGNLLSLQQAVSSVQAVVNAVRGGDDTREYFDIDGTVLNHSDAAQAGVPSGVDFNSDLAYWNGYSALDPQQLATIQDFFALCQANHIQLTVVLMPFESSALQTLNQIPNFVARLREYRVFLDTARRQYGFNVVDFTDPASFGGQNDAFSDYYHPKTATIDHLTRALFAPTPTGK